MIKKRALNNHKCINSDKFVSMWYLDKIVKWKLNVKKLVMNVMG